ncbi:serine/threonine protein kinase [Planctomicrobium sp. SH668]|uniref:serine/threonine protein kinase n=1 Tax=Planctomicrobium sp. SH668 TaxID=3448126 RepID=UPI003F5C4DA1
MAAGNEGTHRAPTDAAASPPPLYSQLNSADRREISDLCTRYEGSLQNGSVPQLEQTILAVETRLQLALLEQLLPIEVDALQRNRGNAPTLHELCILYPNLEELLPLAYRQLPLNVQLPDVLGVYRLVRMVGSGTQATIAIGRHRRLMQSVAIKFSRDDESARRLMQEAAFLSRLSGLQVPQVLDDGRTPDGVAFIVMEYLEGRNLFDLVQDQGTIADPVQCARYALQIAETVEQMHQRGIIHRDLSPRNIHVGDDGILRIVDFGLAIDVSTGMTTRSDIQEFHGTPAFMAPEQRDCLGNINGQLSDIYSIGRLLLFMTNGIQAVLETVPGSRETSPEIRFPVTSLGRIHERATAPDPAQRFRSAEEFCQALRQFVRHRQSVRRTRTLAVRTLLVTMVATAGILLWGRFKPLPQVASLPQEQTAVLPRISQSLKQSLELESIVRGIATADSEVLRQISAATISPEQVLQAFRERLPGSSETAAAQFFRASKENPEAIAWFREMLQNGLDPNGVMPGLSYPQEALLRNAWSQGNIEAMLALLAAGASPHPYEELAGDFHARPRMLYPYWNLMESTLFTADEKQRLATAFGEHGAIVPDRLDGGSTYQSEAIEITIDRSMEIFGFQLESTPRLFIRPQSPLAEQATQRTGTDWNAFLREMPKAWQHDDVSPPYANGWLQVVVLQQLICIADGKACFIGETPYLSRSLQVLVTTDIRGEHWRMFVFGGPGLWAEGEPRPDPHDRDPQSATTRNFWKWIDFVYDRKQQVMTVGESRFPAFGNADDLSAKGTAERNPGVDALPVTVPTPHSQFMVSTSR